MGSYGADAHQRSIIADALGRLPRHISRAEVEQWRALLERGELARLAQTLVEAHYDPAYGRSLSRHGGRTLRVVDLKPGQCLDRVAEDVEALLVSSRSHWSAEPC